MADKQPRIVLVGGGSGGHITPLVAVAESLRRYEPQCHLVYVGQKGDALATVITQGNIVDSSRLVSAGKFRRYHGLGWRNLLKVKTMLLNVRDVFRVVIGFGQSVVLLARLKPKLVFIKGGFVGVPVGLAAALLRIPYVTHDSDALPGLANRIVARWARLHTVALPAEIYSYPSDKTVTVGVPVAAAYRPLDSQRRQAARRAVNLSESALILLVSGGGLGAKRLNDAIVQQAQRLCSTFDDLHIVHQAGRANQQAVQAGYDAAGLHERVTVLGFSDDFVQYASAADVVVARAGGSSLAEFAVLGQAVVLVPNPYLTGGHQLHNAQALRDRSAVRVVQESELGQATLYDTLSELLANKQLRDQLGSGLALLAVPDASDRLARILLDAAGAGVNKGGASDAA